MVVPLFQLNDADERAWVPVLRSAVTAAPAAEVVLAAEEALVAFPAGLGAEMPMLGKHLHGKRKND